MSYKDGLYYTQLFEIMQAIFLIYASKRDNALI